MTRETYVAIVNIYIRIVMSAACHDECSKLQELQDLLYTAGLALNATITELLLISVTVIKLHKQLTDMHLSKHHYN